MFDKSEKGENGICRDCALKLRLRTIEDLMGEKEREEQVGETLAGRHKRFGEEGDHLTLLELESHAEKCTGC
jgi:hypothetical protein